MAEHGWGRQVVLTFGSTELAAAEIKPHELDKNFVARRIYDHLQKTLADTSGPSLARAIYDALSIKPGLLGISLDLKSLLESVFPNIKENLNNLRLTKIDFEKLQIFVLEQDDGTSVALTVPLTKAKGILGEKLFDRLVATSMLRIDQGKDAQYVHVHDLVAYVILAYRRPVRNS